MILGEGEASGSLGAASCRGRRPDQAFRAARPFIRRELGKVEFNS
jgi:hypothetical protein